ncbi:hypothetical protein J7T55_002635 [Diaporthe amygdali]|uniref:uncharacterized protein n=1 Tax=Phomopsis amygdali TaxID=1214568 RepID=UPI0022FE28E6|nr:uncharacterized protein J7T55_002635 [Diaporthe amygdali]KAJ0122123.1 hypothetical protein J7T55_002635 [Diaporthe amygdali]
MGRRKGQSRTRDFELMRLAPELQVKIFEALPDLWTVVALRLTCRDLNALFIAYRTPIEASLRDTLVAPFYEYYDFLASLHIPASAIKRPPAGGWPNITPDACAEFGKTDFAVDVLRHLPYIEDDSRSNLHNIDYKCNVLDYSTATAEDFTGDNLKMGEITHGFDEPVSKHKVVIAEGYESGGIDLLLDTMTGDIFEEIIRCCSGDVLPVEEFFENRVRDSRGLVHVFVPGKDPLGGSSSVDVEPYDAEAVEAKGEPSIPGELFGYNLKELEWVRHLYKKFGWPGADWQKEEGLKAITEFVERRDAES